MAQQRYLRKAPITEALFDFRIPSPVSLSDEQLASIKSNIAERYPKVEIKQQVMATMEFGPQGFSANTKGMGARGVFATSADGKLIAQFRGDGFTFNRLRPYTRWDDLFPEALRLWELFVTTTGVSSVSRLALRYINHLELAIEHGQEFTTYLLMPPVPPEPLPQLLSTFLVRFVAHDQDTEILANVTQSLEAGDTSKLLLDIDVYKVLDVPISEMEEFRRIFKSLRDMKNRIFFGLLTEQCLQPYQ